MIPRTLSSGVITDSSNFSQDKFRIREGLATRKYGEPEVSVPTPLVPDHCTNPDYKKRQQEDQRPEYSISRVKLMKKRKVNEILQYEHEKGIPPDDLKISDIPPTDSRMLNPEEAGEY